MTTDPEEQVRALVDLVCAAHVSHDLAALKTMFAGDATIILGLGQIFHRDEYIAALEHFDTKTMAPISLDIKLLGEQQVAACTGLFEYLARRVPQQTAYERVDIFHTMIWTRESGDWRLLVMQATRVPSQSPSDARA